MLKISNLFGWDFYLKRTNILKLGLKPECFVRTQTDVFQLGRRRYSKQSLIVVPQFLNCQKAKSALVVTSQYSNPPFFEPETTTVAYFPQKKKSVWNFYSGRWYEKAVLDCDGQEPASAPAARGFPEHPEGCAEMGDSAVKLIENY